MFDVLVSNTILAVTATAPTQNSFLYAFNTSDWMGKGVILVLIFGSIITWMIMIEKAIVLSKAKKFSENFNKEFSGKSYPLHAFRAAENNPSPVATVYEAGAQQLLVFYNMNKSHAEFYGTANYPVGALSHAEIEAVQTAMDNKVSEQIHVIEERIGILGTAVSLAPFLGLFGTVWGIMVAFCSLAQLGQASISALAPGVSGALLTTVVGLLVAIPSLIGYNCMTQSIRKLTVQMDNFVEEFIARVKLEQIPHDDDSDAE